MGLVTGTRCDLSFVLLCRLCSLSHPLGTYSVSVVPNENRRRLLHHAGNLATRECRSRSLRAALTQWASHSLGDGERRRKVLTWRGALSLHHRHIADGFGPTFGGSKEGDDNDDGGGDINRPRYTRVPRVLGGNGAQTNAELPGGGNSSTSLPTKLHPPRRSLTATVEQATTVISGRSTKNEGASSTECAGRKNLGVCWDAQEYASKDGEKSRVSADIEREGMLSAAAGSLSTALQAKRALVHQTCSAVFGDWDPEAHMTAQATCDAHAVGDGEAEFREDLEGKQNRTGHEHVAILGGLDLVGLVEASRCTTQGGRSSSRAGGTTKGCGRDEEMSQLLAHETVGVGINETAESDESRGSLSRTSAQLKEAAAMNSAPVVQDGSMGCFDCGGVSHGIGERGWCTARADARELPSVVATPERVRDEQETVADILQRKTWTKSATVSIDVGPRPGMDGERGMLEGRVEYHRTAEEEEKEEENARGVPIAAAAESRKVDDIGGFTSSMGTCHSSAMQMSDLGIPDAEDHTVAPRENKPEAIEKGLTLPPTGQEDSERLLARGQLLPRGVLARENICKTGDFLFRQCSTLLDETTAMMSAGAIDTDKSEGGGRPPPTNQADDMSQGGLPSSVTSVASSPLSRVTATRQSQTRSKIFSTPSTTFINSESRVERVAGPCTHSDDSDSVGPSATGSSGGKEGRCAINAGSENSRAARVNAGDVSSRSQEMALGAEGLWPNEEGTSSRAFYGCGLSPGACADHVFSERTPSEGTTCTRGEICYKGTEKSARKREEEVETTARLCVEDGDGCGMPSVSKLATKEDLEGHRPLVSSSAATADVRTAHVSCLGPRSTQTGVGNRRLENHEETVPAHHSSAKEDESKAIPACVAGSVLPSPLPVYGGGQGKLTTSVERTLVGGELEYLGPPTADATSSEKNPIGERRSSLPQQPTGRRATARGVTIEPEEITATVPKLQREQLGHLRLLSTKQGRHTQLEASQTANSPRGSSDILGTVLANLGEGVAAESATRPKLAVSVRGIPRDDFSPQHPAKRAASSSFGEETGNDQGGALLPYPCKGRALSSELSSISWSDHFEGETQKQPSSLESTEESTDKGTLDGNRLLGGLSSLEQRPTLRSGEPLSHVLPQMGSAEEIDSAAVVVARQPMGSRSSLVEKEELVENNKMTVFFPLTDGHVPASTLKTGDVGVPSTAQHERQTPGQVEHPRGVRRCNDTEELQEGLSDIDRSVRTRDGRCEHRNRQPLLSTSEWPDQAPGNSHGCTHTVMSAALPLPARSQQEPGSDGTVAGTTRAASTVSGTIETAIRVYGIRSCAGGDSVGVPAPEALSSAESGSFRNSDGSCGLPASCDFRTRVGLDGDDGTHPRVTGDRQTGQYGTSTCGGSLRNRSAATLTRPESGGGIEPLIYCESGIVPSSTMLPPPPDAASFSSRGIEDTTRGENRVRKPSISTSRRDSFGQQVGGSLVDAHDELQEPPPPAPLGSLSTCSVGGTCRPRRVPTSIVSSGGGDSAVGDDGRQCLTNSDGRKGSDKATLTSTPSSSNRSSCRRRQRDTLEERVSEAFLRRRLQAVGFR